MSDNPAEENSNNPNWPPNPQPPTSEELEPPLLQDPPMPKEPPPTPEDIS